MRLLTDISLAGWSIKVSSASFPSKSMQTLFSPYSSSRKQINPVVSLRGEGGVNPPLRKIRRVGQVIVKLNSHTYLKMKRVVQKKSVNLSLRFSKQKLDLIQLVLNSMMMIPVTIKILCLIELHCRLDLFNFDFRDDYARWYMK